MDKEKIRTLTNQCLANWFRHFEKFYTLPLPGDEQKRAGIIMGIESLRDDILLALKEEERKSEAKKSMVKVHPKEFYWVCLPGEVYDPHYDWVCEDHLSMDDEIEETVAHDDRYEDEQCWICLKIKEKKRSEKR